MTDRDQQRERELRGMVDLTEGEALTPREEQVMELSEQGYTKSAIGHLLHIGQSTLHNTLRTAWAKLAPGRGRSGAFYEYGRRKRKRMDDANAQGRRARDERSEHQQH